MAYHDSEWDTIMADFDDIRGEFQARMPRLAASPEYQFLLAYDAALGNRFDLLGQLLQRRRVSGYFEEYGPAAPGKHLGEGRADFERLKQMARECPGDVGSAGQEAA